MKALFDTNILIDYLNGIEAARDELQRHEERLISAVTWMEVMVGASKEDDAPIRRFLGRFQLIFIDQDIAEIAIRLRRRYRIRLPDAIIWASAKSTHSLLVSRNTKDFPVSEPDVRMPYSLER